MAAEAVEAQGWDSRDRDRTGMTREEMLDVIDRAQTCVFVRHTKNGHPIGFVVGGEAIDGEIYTNTNLLRKAIPLVEQDPRCSVAFDIPGVASVTVIGRAELVDDEDLIRRFHEQKAPKTQLVKSGRFTAEEWIERAYTPNRRLFHVIAEQWISANLQALR